MLMLKLLCEEGVAEYDEGNPYIYKYTYKRYHEDLILTGWVVIKVDVYGKERSIVSHTVQSNHTDKGLEMIDKDAIAQIDESVIEKAVEKSEGNIKEFRVNRREAVEINGETRLLYFVDALDENGEYAGFSWFFDVSW